MLGHFPFMSFHKGMARGDCSLLHHSMLKGVDNCDVESCILPHSHPDSDTDRGEDPAYQANVIDSTRDCLSR